MLFWIALLMRGAEVLGVAHEIGPDRDPTVGGKEVGALERMRDLGRVGQGGKLARREQCVHVGAPAPAQFAEAGLQAEDFLAHRRDLADRRGVFLGHLFGMLETLTTVTGHRRGRRGLERLDALGPEGAGPFEHVIDVAFRHRKPDVTPHDDDPPGGHRGRQGRDADRVGIVGLGGEIGPGLAIP